MYRLPLRTMLVYHDGSWRGDSLIRLACELMGPHSRIVALAVTLVPLTLPLDGLPTEVDQQARSALWRARDIARHGDRSIEICLRRDRDLASAIVLEAQRAKADVILLAMDRPRFPWLLPRLPRMVRDVLRRAPCPTLIGYFPPTSPPEASRVVAEVEQFLSMPH
jgi:hypothetical protein